ncbi:MAG: hypothetical protein AAGH15_00250 [Myxococcota bacterium]
MRTDLPLDAGTQVVMEILPPGEDEAVHAVGVVRRADLFRRASDPPAGMAIDFLGLDERDRGRLRKALGRRPPALPRGTGEREVVWVDDAWLETALELDEKDLDEALARATSGDLLTAEPPACQSLD